MSETNKKIIDMILKGATANEIASSTGLSNRQLFYRLNMLKTKGYNFSRKYYYDGEIVYKLYKGFKQEKDICLLTSHKDTEFKAVFISDLHFANKADRADLLNQVYDFCVKEGIHVIINGGDIIDGFVGNYKYKKFENSEEQIEYALKLYPFDKNILNFICLGNHDYSILENSGQNLETILSSKRHDIISLGYGIGKLKIKNDEIIVRHPTTPTVNPLEPINEGLMITGHTHRSHNICSGNLLNIYLPSLSDIKMKSEENNSLPGFVKATLKFNNGIFYTGIFEQYIFIDKMYKINESQYDLYKGKNMSQIIKYEEDRIKYEENQIEEETETQQIEKKHELSRIDKFNKRRYGK